MSKMDQRAWASQCIETSLAKLTLSTKCIKQSASFLLTMPESSDLIAKLWLQAFRSAIEPASQLALLYVLNEIIMKCTSYGTPEIKHSFKEPIVEAMKVLRPGLLIKKVKKLLYLWSEKGEFDQEYNKQLTRVANSLSKTINSKETISKSDETVSIKEFLPDKFVKQLQEFKQIDETIKPFSESDLIPSCFNNPVEIILSRIKSKGEGQVFSQQVNACADQLEDVLSNLNRKFSAQESLIRNIDKAILFYSSQQKEAGVVVNAYKSYEIQVRNTLRTIRSDDDCNKIEQSPGAVEMTYEDDNVESLNVHSHPSSNKQKCLNAPDDGDYGGVSDMSEDEGDEDVLNSFGHAVNHTSAQYDVREVLVDPKSLSYLPFSDSILIDGRGDVDYRPMFSKMLASKQINEKGLAREKSLDQSLLSNKDSKSNEPTLLDSQPLDGDGKEPPSALTATGDFDYRQSVAKSEEMNKEQEKYVKTNPFGLGSAVSSQEDADFRLLRTPKSEASYSVADADYRQFSVSHSTSVAPPSASFSYMNSGDSDLRQSQAEAAASALANAVAMQSLLFASVPPPPLTPQPPLFGSIMATRAAPIPSSIPQQLQQAIPISVTKPVPLPDFHPQHSQNQHSAALLSPSVSLTQQQHSPLLTAPIITSQQAHQPVTTPFTPAQFKLADISSDLLSSLKKINLPVALPSTQSSNMPGDTLVSSAPLSELSQDNKQGVVNSEFDDTKSQKEDPFTIISRLTGLSNLIQSANPQSSFVSSRRAIAESSSPQAGCEKRPSSELKTPNYSEDSSEYEVESGATKTTSPNPSSRSFLQAPENVENLEDEDGGATPTQDESEDAAASGSSGFSFPQAVLRSNVLGQTNFPPLLSGKSMPPPPPGNLILPFPMGMPPSFNPMGIGPRLPWQSALPMSIPNLGVNPLPTQSFFPPFSSVFNRPSFPVLPTSRNNK